MDLSALLDTLPGYLFDEAATSNGESTEIVEWKEVLEKIMGELKKEPELMKELEYIDDDIPLMSCLLTNSTVKRMIGEYVTKCKQQIEMGTSGKKNATKAESIRLQGNSLFVKKEYRAAFKMYTRGLMFAKDEETPLLYANRSAAYYYLKQYDNALEDIERALKFGYGNLKPIGKLLIRKGFSLLALGRDDQVKELLDANMLANENGSEFAQWQQLKKESANVNRQIINHNIAISQLQNVSTIRAPLTAGGVFRPHERFPWLNAKIDLLYDAEKGFSLVSKEEMKYGEIVALSKPFVCLDPKRDSYERCHYCMVPCFEIPKYFIDKPWNDSTLFPDYLRMVTPLACSECSNVLYCSEACRAAAWTAYHRFECSEMAILAKMDSKAHLALRMLYMFGSLEEDSPNVQLLSGCETVADPCALMIDQQAYSFVYSNPAPMNQTTFERIFKRSLTVFFLLKLVQMGGLLVEPKNIDDKEYLGQAKKACYLLFRHFYQVEANESVPFIDPITDRTIAPNPVLSVDGMTGIMKNSCEATVAPSSNLSESLSSNVKLLYATGAIPAGTVLSLAYDIEKQPNFEILVRKAQLAQRYTFNCTCTRCVREERDCLDISINVYYPIACSLCGELMIRAGGQEDGDSFSVLDDSYKCSSTDGCNFKYSAQQMKDVYERMGKLAVMMGNLKLCTEDTQPTLQPKVYQLKTTIESTAQLLHGRSTFLAQLYANLASLHIIITMVPISDRYSGSIGTGLSSSTHTVHRGNLTTGLLYTNKAFDILESLKQGPGVKTPLAGDLDLLFDCLDTIELHILEQLFEMLPLIEQVRRRYEALLKMTAYDAMVVSSLVAKE